MEIKGASQAFDTDEKRFYMPGFKITGTCPSCGAAYERDLTRNYLSYPTANTPIDFTCYCCECDHEWSVKIILRITLELAPVGAVEVGKAQRKDGPQAECG